MRTNQHLSLLFNPRKKSVALIQADFVIALFGLLLGAFGLFYFFERVNSSNASSAVVDFGLKSGTTAYSLITPQGCVGTMNLNLQQSPSGLVLNSTGNLRIQYQDKLFEPSFTLDSQFSVLGQLQTSLLRIAVGADEFNIGSVEIDPIRVTLLLGPMGSLERRDFLIPGPFELRELRRGTYRLMYIPFLRSGSNAFLTSIFQSVHQRLPLSLSESGKCDENNAHLDVTEITRFVQSAVSSLSHWLPAKALGQ